jgi:hypothetical protein
MKDRKTKVKVSRKRWVTVASIALIAVAFMGVKFIPSPDLTPSEFKKFEGWENHRVVGGVSMGGGVLSFNLKWENPYLLQGIAGHEMASFKSVPKGGCRWEFNDDFSKVQVSMESPMPMSMMNPEYEMTRVKSNVYEGVWDAGMEKWKMGLTIYPDKMLGKMGPMVFFLKVIPPLSAEEVPPGLQFIFK